MGWLLAERPTGVDMTNEILELARQNRRKAEVENAEFLRGEIENTSLPTTTWTSSSELLHQPLHREGEGYRRGS
jgi:hypothetical protein